MLITRKDKIEKPFENPTGERIYELVGKAKSLGGATKHSVGYVVIPPKKSSLLHYHPEAEETYYVMKGKGRMMVNGKEHFVNVGDVILIHPNEQHQIFIEGKENLEFIVICAPAWEANNSIFIENKNTKQNVG